MEGQQHVKEYSGDLPFREDAASWQVVTLSRVAQPPLRFKGRRLTHHAANSASGVVYLDLWHRSAGGVVVDHAVPTVAGCRTHACSFPSLPLAMDHLEGLCRDGLQVAFDPCEAPAGLAACVDQMLGLYRQSAFNLTFAVLVGDALAQWDELAEKLGPLKTRYKEPKN